MKFLLDGTLLAALLVTPALGGNLAYVAAPEGLSLRDCPNILCHQKAIYPFGTQMDIEGPVFTPAGLTNPWVQVSIPIRNPAIGAPYPTHVVGFVNALYLDFGRGR